MTYVNNAQQAATGFQVSGVSNKAIIYCSGSLKSVQNSEYLIAVDGGANRLYRQNLIPSLVIGDLDSIEEKVLSYYQGRTKIVSYPSDKDETDTELALNWCYDNGISEVIILNELDGSFAHTLGIVSLLFKAREFSIAAIVESGRETIILAEKEFKYSAVAGTRISLVPLSEEVSQVTANGLLYPLNSENLYRSKTRGISNLFVDETIHICYKDGELLVIIDK